MTANAFVESEERQALRKAVAAMAATYGQDYYLEKARAGQHTDELWQEAGKLGFIGVNLPEEYGGGGAGMYELSVVMEEMSANGCPLLLMVVSPAINGTIIAKFGTDEQKKRWLPGIADGSTTMAFAITEPDAGSNSHRITTTARRDGSDWILKGQKVFISGVDQAQAVLVVGRTSQSGPGAKSESLRPALFIVPTDTPGFTWTKIDMELVSPESQFQVFIDDIRLPSDALVGSEDAAIAQLFAGLNPERIMGAASAVGMGRFAINKAVDYVKTRQVWKTPIGAHQGLVTPVGAEPHRDRTRQADDAEGRDAVRQRRRLRRRRGGEHGQVRRGRGVGARGRPGGSVAGRQRSDQGVRHRRGGDRVEAGPHRSGQPRDGAQLHGADVVGSATLVLMSTLVHYSVDGPVARLTLDSPDNRNALSKALVHQLRQGLCDASDDPDVRAVVLGHTGGTFCAGADLSEASGGDAAETVANNARQLTSLLRSILEMPQPVIGAIDGHVRAGGLGLVGACDIVVAGRNSTFALTEARIGVAPSIISLTLLPKMSARAAGRYFVTGEKFGADEAAEIGLITTATDDVDGHGGGADRSRSRKAHRRAWPPRKALTTAPMLEAFDRHAEELTEAVRASCSCPTRRARACWPSCRNAPRTGWSTHDPPRSDHRRDRHARAPGGR